MSVDRNVFRLNIATELPAKWLSRTAAPSGTPLRRTSPGCRVARVRRSRYATWTRVCRTTAGPGFDCSWDRPTLKATARVNINILRSNNNEILTEKPLGAQGPQDVGNGIVEQWHAHRVSHRKPVGGFAEQRAVLERPHGVYPSFAGAVDETAVDPTGDAVYLFGTGDKAF